jgi:hypothetical protein
MIELRYSEADEELLAFSEILRAFANYFSTANQSGWPRAMT